MALFDPGGPFASHPGPVLAVAADQRVLAANPAAERLAQILGQDLAPELSAAIDTAFAGGPARISSMVLPAGQDEGGALEIELLVLPWPASRAVLLLGRDITAERALRGALIDSRQRFKELVEISNDMAWETDREGHFAYVSTASFLGFGSADLVERPAAGLLDPAGLDPAGLDPDNPFTPEHPIRDVQAWCRDVEGAARCLSVTATPLLDPEGRWAGARGTCRDITAQHAREAEQAAARERERLLAFVLRGIRGQVAPLDAIGSILHILMRGFGLRGVALLSIDSGGSFSEAAREGARPVLGDLAEQLQDLGDFTPSVTASTDDGGKWAAYPTRHLERRNGVLLLYRAESDWALDEPEQALIDEIAQHLGTLITQVESHDQLRRLSTTDPLTGLLNRRAFLAGLEDARQQALKAGRPAVLFFMDLNNFKLANDHYGHQQGDAILVELTQILLHHARSVDLVGRLGGDEFGILISGIDADQAAQRAASINRSFHEVGRCLDGPEVDLGLSIGIAWLDPDEVGDPEQWIERADAAMYEVKRQGRAQRGRPAVAEARRAATS